MFYWILRSPPGYPPEHVFTVALYRTPDPESVIHTVGTAARLDSARELIPQSGKRLDCRPTAQFLELWGDGESAGCGAGVESRHSGGLALWAAAFGR